MRYPSLITVGAFSIIVMVPKPPAAKGASPSRWWSTLIIPFLVALVLYVAGPSPPKGKAPLVSTNSRFQADTAIEQSTFLEDLVETSNATLHKRDEYSCKKGSPCKQYACCGAFNGGDEGICGLGPAWCGDDCDSQCNAKAECKCETFHN